MYNKKQQKIFRKKIQQENFFVWTEDDQDLEKA